MSTSSNPITHAVSSDPEAAPTSSAPVVPRHIAIIMDGNGRWAKRQSKPRAFGHRQGAEAARRIVTRCAELGVEALTLYSFSTENWKRPADEIDFLMQLGQYHLNAERDTIMKHNIRFRHIGRSQGLPGSVAEDLKKIERQTASNSGMTLCLALNYGSRQEITDAVRRIADQVAAGAVRADQIDESTIAGQLDTAGLPDPDLLIRTAGELRISNFLLWQISYTEIYVTDVLWPEFTPQHLQEAIDEFARRQRRFGAVEPAKS